MKNQTYAELTALLPAEFERNRSQGRSVYMAVVTLTDGNHNDLVESFIRNTFCIQMSAEKLGFVTKAAIEIFEASMQKNLELAKDDLSVDEFRSLEQEIEKALQLAGQVPQRDRKWVKDNMLSKHRPSKSPSN